MGYGTIRYDDITVLVHRFAALAYGLIDSLDDPRVICHNCNIPLCFEEEHLRADTQKGNLQQMYREGRDNNQYTVRR